MPAFRYLELPISGTRSLAWNGEELVDWLGLAARYGLDGSRTEGVVNFGYRFDSVVQSPDGIYAVLYERRGTKGVVVRGHQVVREIDRSYYQANLYDYPITLFRLPDGRMALAHCPTGYNRLEIELLETGERLTSRSDDDVELADVFHSGLAVDPSGAWLMSAGWLWHPFLQVAFHAIADALREPSLLDRNDGALAHEAEIASAVFLDADRVVLASDPDAENAQEGEPDVQFQPGMIGVYRPGARRWDSLVAFDAPTGRLLAVDTDHVLALYQHPKLIHLPTGRIVESWPQIDSGTWKGCILGPNALPPTSWDPIEKRLAVAASDKIQILTLAAA